MNLATSILGTTAVTKLKATQGAAVLEVGSDTLTRGQLAKVECFNFHAARLLTAACRTLQVPNLRALYDEVPPAMLALPRLGVVSLAVLGAAFEAKGIGGSAPLESYYRKHLNGSGGKVVTFDTLKHREHEEAARGRKDLKRRKGQRRNQAHKLRVGRFEARQPAAQFAKE
jgi:hypothetical protein